LDYLDKELTDGVNDNPMQAVETLRKIKELARQIPIVVLPAHDKDTPTRLLEKTVYKPTTL